MVTVFTIVTRNHLHRARVLMKGVERHLPHARRYMVMADHPGDFVDAAQERFTIVSPTDLARPYYRALAFALDPASLCFALKAAAARHLRSLHPTSPVLYFDSDTQLYAEPTTLVAAAQQYPVVLSPHVLDPRLNAPGNRETMRSGAFNGGLFAVGNSPIGDEFLAWWEAQLSIPENVQSTWNHDQGWLNQVPALFPDTHILRHPGYNVAFWNLHERAVHRDACGDYHVGVHPLVHFHFSFFDPVQPHLLAGSVSPFFPAPNAAVQSLLIGYAQDLDAAGAAECRRWGTELTTFRDGRPITAFHRKYFLERLWHQLPPASDPFDPRLAVPGMTGLKSVYQADHVLVRTLRSLRQWGRTSK